MLTVSNALLMSSATVIVRLVNHVVFSIQCNHLCALGTRCLSCSTSTSSMQAALLSSMPAYY